MPTYEYRCPAGHDFEKFVLKISDAQGTLPCPSCGVEAARQLSAA
ncbi:MAG: FmdB family zinc ribbon protein [Gemmatimonadota bacterium]